MLGNHLKIVLSRNGIIWVSKKSLTMWDPSAGHDSRRFAKHLLDSGCALVGNFYDAVLYLTVEQDRAHQHMTLSGLSSSW
jgi:exosome complex RNA-binding protein Rrp4